jgi:putative ABC transport system permease protein
MRRSLRSWLWRVPVEHEVDEELAFHIEMRARELIAQGVDPQSARETAISRAGDLVRLRRTCTDLGRRRDREMRLTQWIEEFRDDVKFAIRQLKASPAFTAVAALTLALGIGANSAIFALAEATLLRPLPFADPDRLALLLERTPTDRGAVVAPFEFVAWSERTRTFDVLAAVMAGATDRAIAGPNGTAELIPGHAVTVRFFDVLGVMPILGRTFAAVDDHPVPDTIVLSETLWRERFAGDPGIIGRQIRLHEQPATIIGVVPASAQLLGTTQVWTLIDSTQLQGPRGTGHYLRVIGRLKPGVTLEAARADMARVAETIARERPQTNRDRGVTVDSLHEALTGQDLRLTSMLLLGVVGFVLLMCCASVANLLLARTSNRARELAVRAALGAGRVRIARQFLTESIVLAAIGGVAGAAVGAALVKAAPALLPPELLPVTVTLVFDARVLAFCAATAVVVALVFGAVPAWQATGLSLARGFAAGSRTATGHGTRLRRALVAGEVAAAVILLVGAGLLLRTLAALGDVDPGFHARDVLTARIGVPFPTRPGVGRYATPDALRQFFSAIELEVAHAPGVRSVAWGQTPPWIGAWYIQAFEIVGDPPQPEADRGRTTYQIVSPGYFRTLDIPLVAGRTFTDRDTHDGAAVSIVNEAFVRQFLGGRDPLGMRIEMRDMGTFGGPLPVREIVGVVADIREEAAERDGRPQAYVPLAQAPWYGGTLYVQPSEGSAAALAPVVRAAVARVDKDRPVSHLQTLAEMGATATSRWRFRAVLVATFAGLALLLAVIGVFGVLAYTVEQRTREFAVRIALGASAGSVLRMVFTGAGRMVITGALVGLALAAAGVRTITTFLFGVEPFDPVAFAAAALVLMVTAAIAAATPALRAARVDPVVAFRTE